MGFGQARPSTPPETQVVLRKVLGQSDVSTREESARGPLGNIIVGGQGALAVVLAQRLNLALHAHKNPGISSQDKLLRSNIRFYLRKDLCCSVFQ